MEIDLLKNYPKVKRKIGQRAGIKTPQIRRIARRFGKEFFDGDRKYGYGGFNYNPKYWVQVVKDFQAYYHLKKKSSVLDVGCGKGFMLFDLMNLIPGIKLAGIDLSEYAIENCKPEVKKYLSVANAKKLPFRDRSFDLVISINTVHNLPRKDCIRAIREIQRVSKKYSFITVDAFRNEEEKKRMHMWNLTAKTMMHADDWKRLFKKIGYTGDYYWFIP